VDSSRTLSAYVERELLAELLESKRLTESIAHVVSDGLIQIDEARRVVRFNTSAERLLGFSASSITGTEFAALLHADNDRDPLAVTPSREPQSLRIVFRDTRGEPVAVEACAVTISESDATGGWLIAFAQGRRVDEIEQLKNELVSTVSHELKTPLAAIKAYTATLRQNPALYETHRNEFLGVVEQQADRLARLVDDMLLVTRVDSNQLLRRRVVTTLDSIVEQALREVTYDPVKHPIQRSCAGVEVSGDPERLRDVLRNLVENAVKYSPEGGTIEIAAEQSETFTVIEIRDRGIGIADEDVPYIFDRFYRVESQAAAAAGGSGLGLYIVGALVRAHGGSIDVRSVPGEGTVFTLRLPLR
jgi:PAS domain S-box-containing protein